MGMTTNDITASRLHGTDYLFTNLGGCYRLYDASNPQDVRTVATFRTYAAMWAAVNG